jgi:hypothetical protein
VSLLAAALIQRPWREGGDTPAVRFHLHHFFLYTRSRG